MTHRCSEIVCYYPWRLCDQPATRTRENRNGSPRHVCAQHDPVRREQDRKNSKARKQTKRDRWKKMEATRRP